MMGKIKNFYEKQYKLLLIIPFVLLLLGSFQLYHNSATTGSFINKGISLKGGTSLTILGDVSTDKVLQSINYQDEVNTRVLSSQNEVLGVILEIEETDKDKIDGIKDKILSDFDLKEDAITVETMGSSLGSSFFKETIKAMIVAFVFMGIVVFLYFRTFVPSVAVILAAVSDIIITMSIVNIIGIKLSTAGIAAFLMLIGYSVDTDILLSTKVVKKKNGTVDERIYSAMKTGLMMSLTTIVAISVALAFTQSVVISQIMTILLIGLAVDLVNTWIQNVGLLKWYMETKK